MIIRALTGKIPKKSSGYIVEIRNCTSDSNSPTASLGYIFVDNPKQSVDIVLKSETAYLISTRQPNLFSIYLLLTGKRFIEYSVSAVIIRNSMLNL